MLTNGQLQTIIKRVCSWNRIAGKIQKGPNYFKHGLKPFIK